MAKEAAVEMERARAADKRRKAQAELKEVERKRFEKSRLGRLKTRALKLGKAGLKELQK